MTQLMEPPKKERKDRHGARVQSVPRPRPEASSTTVDDKAPVPRWRRIVPALAISVMAGSYVYATVPFTFAGAVECRQNGLSGATVAPGTPAGTLIGDVDLRCAEAGNSRLAVAGVTAGFAAVVGLAGAFAPTDAEVRARKVGGSGAASRAAWRARTMPATARS